MSPAEFAQLRAQAEHNGLLLYYAGTFNPNVIQAAADTLKSRLANEDGSSSAKRKLFSTFIEMAQNVLHYAAPLPAADTGPARRSARPCHRAPSAWAASMRWPAPRRRAPSRRRPASGSPAAMPCAASMCRAWPPSWMPCAP